MRTMTTPTSTPADREFVRRPEVPRLAEELQRQHPRWSRLRCLTEAKHIATAKPTPPTKPTSSPTQA